MKKSVRLTFKRLDLTALSAVLDQEIVNAEEAYCCATSLVAKTDIARFIDKINNCRDVIKKGLDR